MPICQKKLYLLILVTLFVGIRSIEGPPGLYDEALSWDNDNPFAYHFYPYEPSSPHITVVTARSAGLNFGFHFLEEDQHAYPHIIGVYEAHTTEEDAYSDIPAMHFPEDGEVSMHGYQLTEVTHPDYMKAISYDYANNFFDQWLSIDGEDTVMDNLPTIHSYSTIMYSIYVSHNYNADMLCTVSLTYRGIVRAIFANSIPLENMDYLGGSGGSIYEEEEEDIHETSHFLVEKDQYMYIFILGRSLNITDVAIKNCVDKSSENTVSPEFTFYYAEEIGAYSNFYTSSETYISCPEHATMCKNEEYAIQCESGYFLDQGSCVKYCSEGRHALHNGICSPSDFSKSIHLEYVDEGEGGDLDFFGIADGIRPWSYLDMIVLPYAYNIETSPALMHDVGPYSAPIMEIFELMPEEDGSFGGYESIPLQYSGSIESKTAKFAFVEFEEDDYARSVQVASYDAMPLSETEVKDGKFYYWDIQEEIPLSTYGNYHELFLTLSAESNLVFEITVNGYIAVYDYYNILLYENSFGDTTTDFSFDVPDFFGYKKLLRFLTTSTVFELKNHSIFEGAGQDYIVYGMKPVMGSFSQLFAVYESGELENCEIPFDDECLVCNVGYYLDIETDLCSESCEDSVYQPSSRKCIDVCPPFEEISGDYCLPICPDNIEYSDEYMCDEAPGICGDNYIFDRGSCICNSPFVENNGKCDCGSNKELVDGECVDDLILVINGFDKVNQCSQLTLVARLISTVTNKGDSTPLKVSKLSWNADQMSNSTIQNYVESSESSSLNFPSYYFKLGQSITIDATYKYSSSVEQTASHTFYVTQEYELKGENNSNYYINPLTKNTIRTSLDSSGCSIADPDVSYEVISKPASLDFDPLDYVSESNPFWLELPACLFSESSTIEIEQSLKLSNQEDLTNTLFIQTLEIDFEAKILNSFRKHPYTQDLIVDGELLLDTTCSSTDFIEENFEATWTCAKNQIEFDCSDMAVVDSDSSTATSLVIPKSYFEEGDDIQVSLSFLTTKSSRNHESVSSAQIEIGSATILPLNITCTEVPCRKYTNSKGYNFRGTYGSTPEINTLDFEWSNSLSTLPIVAFKNRYKILQNSISLSTGTLTIELNAQGGAYLGQAKLELPINTPPTGGSISVTPATGGTPLVTEYRLLAENWLDDDRPLAYSYFYSATSTSTKIAVATKKASNDIYSKLPKLSGGLNSLYVWVSVSDVYGSKSSANTQITFASQSATLSQTKASAKSIVETLSTLDPITNIEKLAVAAVGLSSSEEELIDEKEDSPCPSCSGNGYCRENYQSSCVCNEGWTLYDCSEKLEDFEDVLNVKKSIVQKLKESIELGGDDVEEKRDLILNSLKGVSDSTDFNDEDLMTEMQSLLTNQISNKSDLDEDQSLTVTQIVDNMVNYAAQRDCGKATEYTESIGQNSITYLESVTQSSLQDRISGESPKIVVNDGYDIYIVKVGACDIADLAVQTSDDTPSLKISPKSADNLDCSKELYIQYYVFLNDLFDCNTAKYYTETEERRLLSEEKTKGYIALKVADADTGEDLGSKYSVEVELSEDEECYADCEVDSDGSCHCEDISFFDIEGQMTRLFARSNLALLQNIDVLFSYPFYKTVSMWALVVFTLWFFGSYYLVKKKYGEKFCKLQNYKRSHSKSDGKALWTAFIVTHPMISIYTYHDPNALKTSRLIVFYAEILLLLAFNTIFSDVTLDDGRGWSFNVYLILLPFVTYLPIVLLLEKIIAIPKPVTPREKKISKIRWIIGGILTAIIILGSIVIILVITAQQTSSKVGWLFNFVIVFFEEIWLSPSGMLMLKLFIMRLLYKEKLKSRAVQKRAEGIVGQEVLIIYNELFQRKNKKARSLTLLTLENIDLVKESKNDIVVDSRNSLDEQLDFQSRRRKDSDEPSIAPMENDDHKEENKDASLEIVKEANASEEKSPNKTSIKKKKEPFTYQEEDQKDEINVNEIKLGLQGRVEEQGKQHSLSPEPNDIETGCGHDVKESSSPQQKVELDESAEESKGDGIHHSQNEFINISKDVRNNNNNNNASHQQNKSLNEMTITVDMESSVENNVHNEVQQMQCDNRHKSMANIGPSLFTLNELDSKIKLPQVGGFSTVFDKENSQPISLCHQPIESKLQNMTTNKITSIISLNEVKKIEDPDFDLQNETNKKSNIKDSSNSME